MADDQQFCLRWNNFQANITSQFETLRDDEDFTDVTIACEGQRLQAHKVVLSACSPFFKELFKSNPCSHPIIFMRDVEARHIVALMEFMYAGEVNVAQAHLPAFLKTAESLKIRGLTDTSSLCDFKGQEEDTSVVQTQDATSKTDNEKPQNTTNKLPHISSTSTVTSSQDFSNSPQVDTVAAQPPSKRQCKDKELERLQQLKEDITLNTLGLQQQEETFQEIDNNRNAIQPKLEIPDYISDEDKDDTLQNLLRNGEVTELAVIHASGGMEIIPQNTTLKLKEAGSDTQCTDFRKPHSLEPRPCDECGRVYSNLSNLRQHMKLIHYPTFVTCPFCKKPFKTDLYLRRHVLSCHDNPKNGFTLNNNGAFAKSSSSIGNRSIRFSRSDSTAFRPNR